MTIMNNEDLADPNVHEPLISLEDIRGAVVRGWCHPANVDKVMDLPLALAIANEVHAALYAAQQPAPQSAEDRARDKAYMAAMPMPELAPRMAQTTEGRYHDFTLAEAMEIAKRNDPGDRVPSTSRTFIAEIVRLRKALLYTADPMREAIAAERERSHELLQAADHIRAGLEAELAALSAALAELVALKDMKDRLTELHEMGHGTDYDNYHKRRPLAWAAARAALSAQPGTAVTDQAHATRRVREGTRAAQAQVPTEGNP